MEQFGAWIVSAITAGVAAIALLAWRRQTRRYVQADVQVDIRNRSDIKQFIKALPDHSFVIDRSGRILAFHQPSLAAAIPLLILPEVDKQLLEVFPATLVNLVELACEETLSTGITVSAKQDDIANDKQSMQFWLTVMGEKRDEAAEFLLILRNTNEIKAAEQMKGDFISKVSHEMRTPLTSIAGALGLIAGGELDDLPENVVNMVAIAYKNSQRLSRLVNDLLDIEKISAGKLTLVIRPYQLNPLLEQALDASRNYAESYRVGLIMNSRVSDAEIMLDSDRFLQVMDNLLSNAIKFSPENSRVEVHVHQLESRLLRISVIDHGPGISESCRANIFQKFFHTNATPKHEKSGSGLGLALAKELVELMGGTIGFECAKGSGTIFYIDFPQIGDLADLAQAGLSKDFQGKRVLVVEDEAEVARLISLMLQQQGYRVDIAMSGVEAMHALREFHYDAVTVDLLLPDFSGLEVIRRIRTNSALAHISIVVVSAKLEAGQLMYSGDASAIEWLAKPVGRDQLLHAVEKRLHDTPIEHLLYVEDDTDLQYVIRAMAGKNYHIVPAATLAQARATLAKQSFDVILLDIGLPDGSGWELLPEIRKQLPTARVVMLSGEELSSADVKKAEAVLLKSKITERQLLNALESMPKSPE